MTFEEKVSEAMQAVETGVTDAKSDFPGVHEDDLYFEIAGSVAAMYGGKVGAEVRRRLGF